MRLAVLIIGLLLGAVMFAQTLMVYGGSSATQQEQMRSAASIGVFMALLWLVGCALVLSLPIVSVILFTIASMLGFAVSGDFPDLGWWGGVSLGLAVLSLFGWLGKRKQQREQRAERARQLERDQRMEALLRHSQVR